MFETLIADINGIWRGLQTPIADMDKTLQNGVSFPRSLYAMRFDGGIVEDTGLGLSTGDPDYPCFFLPQTNKPVAWRDVGMQAVAVMQTPDGAPFYADPRAVLAAVVDKLRADGLLPLMAVELEFYLHDEHSPISELYSSEAISRHADFLALLRRAAAAQNIDLGATTSEYAPGQFEINLNHKAPLAACLEALLFRRIVRECARTMGRSATFMAKPRANCSGSGMHLHLSMQNGEFANRQTLLSATAGVMALLSEAMAFFAPFGNSYRRFVAGAYAPLAESQCRGAVAGCRRRWRQAYGVADAGGGCKSLFSGGGIVGGCALGNNAGDVADKTDATAKCTGNMAGGINGVCARQNFTALY